LEPDPDPGSESAQKCHGSPSRGYFLPDFLQFYFEVAFSRALNYHGQQLMSFLKDSDVCRVTDLKNVDYHLYQQVNYHLIFLLLLLITLILEKEERYLLKFGIWRIRVHIGKEF
jgi:hypothetical protein